jgi:hypothetical protein
MNPKSTLSHPALLALLMLLPACGGDDGEGSQTGAVRCRPDQVERGGECLDRNEREDRDTTAEADTEPADVIEADAPEDVITADTTRPDSISGNCAEGATRCGTLTQPEICQSNVWTPLEACSSDEICLAGACSAGVGCTPGSLSACASETSQSVCNTEGTAFVPIDCPESTWCFETFCGAQRCEPGTSRCDGDFDVLTCFPDGTDYSLTETCDRRGGRVCSGGECVSGCAAIAKESTYVGCEYWTVDLPQYPDPTTAGPASPHSVVVGNVSEFPAQVTVESFSSIAAPGPVTASPGLAATVQFPRADIAGTGITDRSFRVRTTEPIVAYQFNPLNNVNLFSNDASLLLPVNALGREYLVLGWPAGVALFGGLPAQKAFVTIIATGSGNTQVTIVPSCDVNDGGTITGWTAGEERTITLTQGQVLNLDTESAFSFPPTINDFTGTSIRSDKPVAVFAGHEQAVIGEDGDGGSNCCADHLEEQLYPVSGWGRQYLAVHSPPRGTEPDYWRVLASADNTRIVTSPAIAGLDGQVINRGEFIEVNTPTSFELNATAPVLVGQYLASQQSAGVDTGNGDPSFILSVPVEGFRDQYVVLTPDNYDDDYLTIIRPTGVEVSLDLAFIPDSEFTPLGTLNYEYAWMPVNPGSHQLSSELPFGVIAIGYDGAVSYGFPAGLNVAQDRP